MRSVSAAYRVLTFEPTKIAHPMFNLLCRRRVAPSLNNQESHPGITTDSSLFDYQVMLNPCEKQNLYAIVVQIPIGFATCFPKKIHSSRAVEAQSTRIEHRLARFCNDDVIARNEKFTPRDASCGRLSSRGALDSCVQHRKTPFDVESLRTLTIRSYDLSRGQ